MDELKWVKEQITKLLVDVAADGVPKREELARELGRVLAGYKEPCTTRADIYRAALGLGASDERRT